MQTFAFTPSNKTAPNFMPMLDGERYNCTVTWNLSGQRYYLNVFTLSGNLVVSLALVTSPMAAQIETATYDPIRNVATLTMSLPHLVTIGATVARWVAGCDPDDYDGAVTMLATGATTFDYTPLSVPILAATTVGTVSGGTSLLAGYFTSTMLYRGGTFEVNP